MNNRMDFDLHNKMASLELVCPSSIDISDVQSHSSADDNHTRRVLRKRTQSPVKMKAKNRRVVLKPKKFIPKTLSEEELKKIYSNTKVKAVSQKLETIFEEPKAVNDSLLLIGGQKIKRSLKFPESSIPTHTKEKIKKRRLKIKRFLGNKNFANRKKMSMQAFLKILQNLDADEPDSENENS